MNRSTDRSLSPAHSSNRYLHVGRSSKNKVPTVSFGGKSRSIHKTDNRKTEHEASFVEWEPATQMPFKPDRLTNPISLSEDEMDVSRWISEQKRLIGLDTSTGANQPGMKPAGKKYSSDYHYPTSFAWDKENIHSNVQDPDYARGEAKLNTYNDLYQYDTSEHDQQFKWRATDRVVSAAPVAKGSPIVLNYDNANDGGMLSEYDRQCMDLRNKQQQLLGSEPEPVAGITYEKNEKLPMSLNYEGKLH